MKISELYQWYTQCTGVATDTRQIQQNSLFFCLKGERFNGNAFVQEAFEKGALAVVADELIDNTWKETYKERLILVDDALTMLQALAAYHRLLFPFPVLAITGSNGKTTTKELIAAVLSKKYRTAFTKGNLNNHIGIPLTLLSISISDTDFAVIEMGANHQREIAGYCVYTRPDFGLITNIGKAHLEGFGGIEGVIKGKSELYEFLQQSDGKVFVNADNETLNKSLNRIGVPHHNLITYGTTDTYCTGTIVDGHSFLKVRVDDIQIATNLVGDYNFENVLSAICIGKYFGVQLHEVKEAIESYIPANNRSQQTTIGTNTIIADAYNANPSSMLVALRNFEKQAAETKMVILGEMMELGDYSREEHQKMVDFISSPTWSNVVKVLTGAGFEFAKNTPGIIWFATTNEVKQWYASQSFHNTLILIKGSRKNQLEKVFE
jgi:UDP-N-acetylmuramoyl-tripeptide--D-alanyl-D-alanine ligase